MCDKFKKNAIFKNTEENSRKKRERSVNQFIYTNSRSIA